VLLGYWTAPVRRTTLLSCEAFGMTGWSDVVWGEAVVRRMTVGYAAVQSVVLSGEGMRASRP
jgi:hypothetical protein